MPPRKVQFVQGHYYHIYNRGAGRQALFREDRNYQYLLKLLKECTAEENVSVISYCLMSNHYHWCLRQDGEQPVGNVPTRVWNSYTRAYNNAYGRTGTLFEGRFKAIQVDSDGYLRHLCRYIHANPVTAGFAAAPELWPYSNYLEWIEARNGTLVDRALVKQLFPSAQSYRDYVLAYLTGQAQMPQGPLDYLRRLENG
jgi:putative transposase